MAVDALDSSVTEALRAWRVQHSAGIAVNDTLATCAPICSFKAGRDCFLEASERAGQGRDIGELLNALAPLLSEAERATIAAGWRAGRVEPVMDAVITQREMWFTARRAMKARLMMPLIVLLMASFIAPIPRLVAGGSMAEYLLSAVGPLLIAFAFWKFLFGTMSRARARGLAQGQVPPGTWLDRLLLAIPVVRSVEKSKNLAELATYLSNLISAGVVMSQSLETCARALSNGVYREAVQRCARLITTGNNLAAGLTDEKLWPREYVQAVDVGEKTGKLDETLARMANIYRDNYLRAVDQFAEWIPRVIYGIVCLFIIYGIYSMMISVSQLYNSAGI
jgi:type II secretory pathway component PulF